MELRGVRIMHPGVYDVVVSHNGFLYTVRYVGTERAPKKFGESENERVEEFARVEFDRWMKRKSDSHAGTDMS
jgi:hypothetical protein